MPFRRTASKYLAELLGVLSNPHRVRLVEELSRNGEMDVGTLEAELGISHSAVSQHLSLLRAHRIVLERRDGRHVRYRLSQQRLANWIMQGLDFLGRDLPDEALLHDVEQARLYWTGPPKPPRVAKRAAGKVESH